MLGWIYKKLYLSSLFFLGSATLLITKQIAATTKFLGLSKIKLINKNTQIEDGGDYEDIDNKATSYGDIYRGLGVTVGLLGFIAVFLEIFPSSFDISDNIFSVCDHVFLVGHVYMLLKLVCMIMVGLLVLIAILQDYKEKWREYRLKAETLRYAHLAEHILHLHNPDLSKETELELVASIKNYLNNTLQEQIIYNESKGNTYQSIVNFCRIFTWFGFLLSVLLGIVNVLLINKILIVSNPLSYPTQFYIAFLGSLIPAMIATLNGINSFLKLSDLQIEHQQTAENLIKIKVQLESTNDTRETVDLSKMAYQVLSFRDIEWYVSTYRQPIAPS